jgi:major membrane immunogen (membrane-anchored lipoprotein)
MRKSLFVLAVVLTAAILITSCGSSTVAVGYAPGQTTEAYAYTHGGYVGKAVVKTMEGGKLDVMLDEAFLPHTLAIVDMDSDDWTEENTAYYLSRGNQVRVAKFVSYAGTNYVGGTFGGALIYVEADEAGMPTGGTDLEKAILRNQATMAAYYDNIAAGEFMVYTEFGGTGEAVTSTSYGGLTKIDSNYWGPSDRGPGWKENMKRIETLAEESGVGFGLGEMVKGDDNVWKVGDVVSGATASDFKDYFGLVQTAVGRLKME